MPVVITAERPDTADAVELIGELEAELAPLYPRASRHGLNIEQLLAERVAFFVLRANGIPAGCGGLKLFGATYGEIKRMYVRGAFRGAGFGTQLLEHLAAQARHAGVGLLRLETGIHQHAAIRLYERMGYRRIPAFGPYQDDPLSVFYERQIG